MAWESGFFNSLNGDKTYNSDDISFMFEGLISNGVYESVGNKLAVQPNNGMTIQIATGRGYFGLRWVRNTSEYLQTLEASDVLLNRYCAVCVRVDNTESVRDAVPYFKYSEFATNPVKPSMERTEDVKEFCLAYVFIRAGATEITAADIEDARANEDVCGWVTGIIKQLSTKTLYEQYAAVFYNWLAELQEVLNENTEARLVSALPATQTITLTASGWTETENGYTQTANLVGMTNTRSVIISPKEETIATYYINNVRAIEQGENELIFASETLPGADIEIDILHMGE